MRMPSMPVAPPFSKRVADAAHAAVVALTLTGLTTASETAGAVDGCLVLLCLAAPSWSSIQQCVPPVHQVLDDLAHGHPFPSCSMSGGGNDAHNQWASAPDHCPPQYTHVIGLESGESYSCDFDGAVEVDISGQLWSRTWWSFKGDTVTEFTPAAKAQLVTWNPQFDDDYAAWLAHVPPPGVTSPGAGP
jgi:hypothetical protein